MRSKHTIYKTVEEKIKNINETKDVIINYTYSDVSNNLALEISFKTAESQKHFEECMKEKNMRYTKQNDFMLWTHNLQKDNFWKAFKNLIEALTN